MDHFNDIPFVSSDEVVLYTKVRKRERNRERLVYVFPILVRCSLKISSELKCILLLCILTYCERRAKERRNEKIFEKLSDSQ